MWNRQSESSSPSQRQASPQPQGRSHAPQPQVVPPPAAQPLPVAPRPSGTEPARPAAIIGRAVSIRGDILSEEDLYIDGQVEGTVFLDGARLTVGPAGKVNADIKARDVVVQGSLQGKVEATEKITIRKDGTLVGDVKMAGIVIEDGAYFKGSIDITRPAPKSQAGSNAA